MSLSAETAMLIVPALSALGAAGAHAWKTRGPRIAITFLGASLLFGILRGNFIGWFMRDASRQLGMGSDGGLMPYVMGGHLLRIGHASLFECCGWTLALYLAWTLSERVLQRLPTLATRLFPLLLLASVFTAALGYAVEAGANAMHWWGWTIPLQSKLLIDVPAAGLWAWFSVAPDFLLPFLLLVGRRGSRLGLLSLLLFPLHMASNLLDLAASRAGWAVVGEPSWLVHLAMLVALVLLAALSRLEVLIPKRPATPTSRVWEKLPVAIAGFVLGVLWAGIGPAAGRWDLLVATGAFLVFILLGIPSLPLRWVAIVPLALAPLAAGRGLAAAIPLLTVVFLRSAATGSTTGRRRGLLFASALGGLALVLIWQVDLERAAKSYLQARILGSDWPRALRRLEQLSTSRSALHLEAGMALSSAGYDDLAINAFRSALRVEPDLAPAHNGLGLSLLRQGRPSEAATELARAARLVPSAAGLHQNLGLAELASGHLEAARAAFAKAHELDPEDARPAIGLARVAAAAGNWDEVTRILADSSREVRNPAEIDLALGELYQVAGKLDLAERQFHLATSRSSVPARAIGHCRLAVLLADRPGRLDDALKSAESAVALERSDLSLDTLGWVLLRKGRIDEARAVFVDALAASSEETSRQRIRQHLAAAGER